MTFEEELREHLKELKAENEQLKFRIAVLKDEFAAIQRRVKHAFMLDEDLELDPCE